MTRRVLIGVGVGFGVWVVLVVIGQIFGSNADVSDDAALMLAAGGLVTILFNQGHHDKQLEETTTKVERVVEAVNHVEEDDHTLSSLLRDVDRKIDELAARLDELTERPAPAGTSVTPQKRPRPRKG